MASATQESKIRYIAGGSIGEPKVLSALTDIPASEIQRVALPGYGLRVQPLSQVRQDFVRNNLT